MLLRFRMHEVLRDPFAMAGQLGASAIQAGAAESAASTQADAAKYSANLQSQAAANSLGFQQNVFNTGQANEKPFLQAGQNAVTQLSGLLQPGGDLSSANQWNQTFQSPTEAQAENTPGYQFALQQGDLGLQRAQAASGSLLSGGAAKELESYNQGLADTNYQNVYNNAMSAYGTNYNTFEQNQNQQYNRLAGLAGTGQTSAGQLNSLGQSAATNVGNINQAAATGMGNAIEGGANASAAGTLAAGNAFSSGLAGISNSMGMGGSGGMNGWGSMGSYFGNLFGTTPTADMSGLMNSNSADAMMSQAPAMAPDAASTAALSDLAGAFI